MEQEINLIEIDGRLNALTEQRNAALNQVVLLSGKLIVLMKELEDLKDEPEHA